MSTVYSTAYTTLVRDQLQDVSGGTEIWSDAEIADHVLRAIKDVSLYRPYLQESILSLTDDRRIIDISSLSDRVYIDRAEFYVDRSDRRWRNWTEFGDEITLDIDFNADASDTLLTGTVTFAASTAVTGSGTAFETEAPAGTFIKNSADTEWYEVLSVTSDTALTLRKSYGGTTGADTVSTTPMRTYKQVARIFWGGMHTITTTTSTLPTELEQLIVDGGCAYTLRGYTKRAREALNAVSGAIATGGTELDFMAAQSVLARTDIANSREDIAKKITEAELALGKISTRLTNALSAYMTPGSALINTVNIGSNAAATSLQYAHGEMQLALTHIQEFKAQMEESSSLISEDLVVGNAELNLIGGYVKEAQGYFAEAVTETRMAQAILQHSMADADRREAVFREGLRRAQGRQRRTAPRVYPRVV